MWVVGVLFVLERLAGHMEVWVGEWCKVEVCMGVYCIVG